MRAFRKESGERRTLEYRRFEYSGRSTVRSKTDRLIPLKSAPLATFRISIPHRIPPGS